MSHKLIDHNDDLRRLRDEGYCVAIEEGYLVVRDIPYVNEKRAVLKDGILAAALDLADGETTIQPSTHTIKFIGQCPCASDGAALHAIRPNPESVRLTSELTTNFEFSSKPPRGHYVNFHEKISTYAAILAGHATDLDSTATPRTRRVVEPQEEDSPFEYLDSASARAEINMITKKLGVERLAIVGLGGTGSYVLDLLAKTPAKEIHLFDKDVLSAHNAFRAPGAASKQELREQPLKVDYFKAIYSKMHRGIIPHPEHISPENIDQLRDMACVFLCIDASPAKKFIVEKLEEFGLPFIDTGMGLYATNEILGGTLRVVTSEPQGRAAARARMSFAGDDEHNEYDKNIQIADLNALNATLAVIRWKKMRRFYFDFKNERYTSYTVGTNVLTSEDIHESH